MRVVEEGDLWGICVVAPSPRPPPHPIFGGINYGTRAGRRKMLVRRGSYDFFKNRAPSPRLQFFQTALLSEKTIE